MLRQKRRAPGMAMRSLLPRARACRYSLDRDPVAFCRGTPAVRKCNPAARSAEFPISGRYPTPRNLRGPAGCGNKRSRSQRKFSDPAGPFPISVADIYQSPLRPPADRDDRFANSESASDPSTKTRTCRRCRGRVRLLPSYVLLHRLIFLWIQECRHTRGPAEAKEHQSEMKRENEMRNREEHSRNTSTAQIGQDGVSRLCELQRRIMHAASLRDTAQEEHQHHQTHAVGRRPEVQLNQGRVTPFPADQTRHDVIHRAEDNHGEERVEPDVRVSDARFAEVDVTGEA